MITSPVEKLNALYAKAEEQMPFFKRNLYEQAFDKYYQESRSIYEEINGELEGKDDEVISSYVSELADAFVGIFKAEYDLITKKGKKHTYVTDHNSPLVIYILPGILHYPAKWAKPLVEAIVAKWNATFTELNIGYGTYEDIKSGFKTKLCYITTAVCESIHKSDDCRELTLLREYRDNILSNEEGGKDIINEYYDIAPTIVKRINRSEDPDAEYLHLYDEFILKCIKSIEDKEYDKCRKTYTDMVTELKNKYAY